MRTKTVYLTIDGVEHPTQLKAETHAKRRHTDAVDVLARKLYRAGQNGTPTDVALALITEEIKADLINVALWENEHILEQDDDEDEL